MEDVSLFHQKLKIISNLNLKKISVLSLFTVVQWPPGGCSAPSGEIGNCLADNECLVRGGIPGGPCAGGYGMCCICMTIQIQLI